MIIKIIRILDYKNKTVEFSSKYGTAFGKWKGDNPTEGIEYDVEIDIPQQLIWEQDIKVTDEEIDKIEVINNKVVIIGQLETTEDNCIYIQVGTNLIIVEVDRIINIDSTKVKCELDNILLYNTHLF